MDAIDIFKEAIYYPTNDLHGWGTIAAIFLVTGIFQQLAIYYSDYSGLLGVLSFIISILLMGIFFSIIKSTLDGKEEIPKIDVKNNLLNGLKYLIVNIVYVLIPTILVFIVSIIAGTYSNIARIIISLNGTNVTNATTSTIVSSIPIELIRSLLTSISIVIIVALIAYIIFELLLIIAQGRLAETGNIFDALNIKEVVSKISSIGWGKYILFIIVSFLLIFVIGLISGLVTLIPYVGKIISSVVIESYLCIVLARAIGLIYNEG